MNQSALIGGALLGAFALFIASRNRLSTYGRVLWGAKPASHDTPASEPKSPTQGAIPGTGNFDPLDILGDYGYGLGDVLKQFDNMEGGF